ncbi:MAG: hypothetical protein D4R88_07125 [Methanosarcinales archaeon]|nr:MAG: hypothetical protein D4R88_07125 [Methanosarcinales archaeon]
MLSEETKSLLPLNEEVSKEMQKLVEDALKNEFLFGNSRTVFESVDKLFLYDENTEAIYSKFASKLLILLFAFDFSRRLNNRINEKYKIEPIDIRAIIQSSEFKKYYKEQDSYLEKDSLLLWFFKKGLPTLENCLDKKEYNKLKDVFHIGTNLDLLKEYLTRIEDDSDFYEILSQFTKTFEKYPARTSKRAILILEEDYENNKTNQQIFNPLMFKFETVGDSLVDKIDLHY